MGKTSEYYKTHPDAERRHIEYQKKYNSSERAKHYRAELNKANRDAGTYGKMKEMHKDRSHTKSGKLVLEDSSKNRARNGADGKSTKK